MNFEQFTQAQQQQLLQHQQQIAQLAQYEQSYHAKQLESFAKVQEMLQSGENLFMH